MRNIRKEIIEDSLLRRGWSKLNQKRILTFIHIGKCGGTSLMQPFQTSYLRSPQLLFKHRYILSMHGHRASIENINQQNLIAFNFRCPIDIISSAFYNYHPNYHNHHITKHSKHHLDKLAEFYKKTPTFQIWAEKLMKGYPEAQQIFSLNFHTKRLLTFYLINPERIKSNKERIIHIGHFQTLETDNQRLAKICGFTPPAKKLNASGKPQEHLSPAAEAFLKNYLKAEYEIYNYCLELHALQQP